MSNETLDARILAVLMDARKLCDDLTRARLKTLDARILAVLTDARKLCDDLTRARPNIEQAVALGALAAVVRILEGLLP